MFDFLMDDSSWSTGFFNKKVTCPECGDEYIHFDKVPRATTSDNYNPGPNRGDQVVIPFICEAREHQFEVVFGFHKGEVFVGSVLTGVAEPSLV